MIRCNSAVNTRGFSLVEVLVALIVTSVGLLGVVKIEALALSSTGTARINSLVASATASLAATMRADRAYWANLNANTTVTVNISNTTITASDPTLLLTPNGGCTAASPCTAGAQIAAQDLHDWTIGLKTILPPSTNPTAGVTCQKPNAGPVTCAIHVLWTDHLVSTLYSTNTLATAQQTAQAIQQAEQNTYTLYAEP